MVRVISEKFFSPPRSRHSSGETVDKELAARTVRALSSLHTASVGATSTTTTTTSSGCSSRRGVPELSDYESSSDSYWESEVDCVEDRDGVSNRDDDEEFHSGGADVLQKRKERRRERNKLSAQAYRIRRRQQCMKQMNVQRELEERNSVLKNEVMFLEEQIDQLRRSASAITTSSTTTTATALPIAPSHPNPSDSSTSFSSSSSFSPLTSSKAATSTTLTPTSTVPPPPSPPTLDTFHRSHQPFTGMGLCPLEGAQRGCAPYGFMADNDPTNLSRQFLAVPPPAPCAHHPLVDNFSFSHQPSVSPSPSCAASSPSSPSDAPSSSGSSFSGFSFPVPSSLPSVYPRRRPIPGMFRPVPFHPPSASVVAAEVSPLRLAHPHPNSSHPHPHLHEHFQAPPPLSSLSLHLPSPSLHLPSPHPPPGHIDLNANAEEGTDSNLNTTSTSTTTIIGSFSATTSTSSTAASVTSFGGACQRSDNVNNNADVISATFGFRGARPKTPKAVGAVNLVMRANEVLK